MLFRSETKKIPFSITLDPELMDSFKAYLNRFGQSNLSSGINVALRTFLHERQFLSDFHIPNNVILIPITIYQEMTGYAYKYVEQAIAKEETKTITLNNTVYVALSKREEERIFHKFNAVLPASNQIKNMQLLLERIAQKNGVRIFNPMTVFKNYQNTKTYSEIFLNQYISILQLFEREYTKSQDFFLSHSEKEIVAPICQLSRV